MFLFPSICFQSILSWNANLMVMNDSLKHGLNMLQSMQSDNKSSNKSLKVLAVSHVVANILVIPRELEFSCALHLYHFISLRMLSQRTSLRKGCWQMLYHLMILESPLMILEPWRM